MTSFQNSTPLTPEEVEILAEDSSVSRTKSVFMDEELKIGRKIGDGSFGHVYEAFYMGDKVAVKVFRTESSTLLVPLSESCEEDISNEADIMIRKANKHVVRLLHYSKSKKVLVMEYCANGSVFDFMRQAGNRPAVEDWSNRLKWMLGVALGMLALHEEPPPVLHRDLKLPNVFLDDNLEAKIGDLGLALKISDISPTHDNRSRPDLAMTYQPPEVRSEGRYSTKSDVYSFGIMMHELLLLKGPYGLSLDAGFVDIRVNILRKNGEKPSIPEDTKTIPGQWNPCLKDYIKLINECLEDNPEKRPEFREIARRLALVRKAYEKAKKRPDKNQTIRCVLGVFMFIVIFITFLFLLIECGRVVLLSKKHGNQFDSRMKSDEYYFFEVLLCIGMMAFAAICCWIIWIKRKSIGSFLMMCAKQTRRGWKHLISRVNKCFEGTQSVAPECQKRSAFAAQPYSRVMGERTPDIEMGAVPSLLGPESIDRNEAFCNDSLQSPLSSSLSQGSCIARDEDVVTIDDDLLS